MTSDLYTVGLMFVCSAFTGWGAAVRQRERETEREGGREREREEEREGVSELNK